MSKKKEEKKKVRNPHDRFFKELFSDKEVMNDFIEKTFPEEIVNNLNLESLSYENTSYLDENLQTTYSDTVYNCVYNNEAEIKVTLLFEHKSYQVNYPHFQLLSYMLSIWEKQLRDKKKLTPVIPIIFYHGKGTFNQKNFFDYFDKNLDENLKKFTPNFEYLVIDTNEFSNEEIENMFDVETLKIGMLFMKNIFTEKEIVLNMKKFFSNIEKLLKTENGEKFFSSLVAYLFYTTKIKTHIFLEKISEISEEAGKKFVSTADLLISEGKKKGIIEGMQKGRKEGIEKIAFNLIYNGFDNRLIKKVTSLDINEIKRLRELQN